MAATAEAHVTTKKLESVRSYIAMLLNLEADDIDGDPADDDVQVVTDVTVDEVATNTLADDASARAILENLDEEPRTGVEHKDGERYEIEPRQ